MEQSRVALPEVWQHAKDVTPDVTQFDANARTPEASPQAQNADAGSARKAPRPEPFQEPFQESFPEPQPQTAELVGGTKRALLSNAALGPVSWSGVGVTFVSTRSQACPYLEGKTERKLIAPITRSARRRFSALNEAGFRRSNAFVYRPICADCQACMAARVVVPQFQASKTQRRIARRNADLRLEMASAMATEEHYELFRRYLDQRHFDGDMALMDEDDFAAMIEETSVRTNLFEWRDPEDKRLLAACLVDHLEDGFSMVYSYYDPDQPERSLGVAMILSLIALAAKANLPHVYLGYWVKGSRKMSYKQSYRPLEVFHAGRWRLLSPASDFDLVS